MNLDSLDWQGALVQLGYAIVILLVTWLLARLVRSLLARYLAKIKVLNNTNDAGETIASSLARIGSLVIWLFGLMAILDLFQLTQVLTPLQSMMSSALNALPGIIGAALIFFIGLMLARIARDLLVTALQAANIDRYVNNAAASANAQVAEGLSPTSQAGDGEPESGTTSSSDFKISTVLGQLVYALILLVVAIAALQVLGIESISQPATAMLSLILNAVPLVLGAAILLAIGVMIARFVSGMLTPALRGMNLDSAVAHLGIKTKPGERDVASVVSLIVQIAIVLFFALAATRLLNFPALTAIIDAILELGGRVVFGGLVIAAGVFIANILSRLVGGGQTGRIVQWATVILSVAIGLTYMGLADSIVNLAFGALVVGGAAAAALAFGLGGRKPAEEALEKLRGGNTKKS